MRAQLWARAHGLRPGPVPALSVTVHSMQPMYREVKISTPNVTTSLLHVHDGHYRFKFVLVTAPAAAAPLDETFENIYGTIEQNSPQ